MKKSLYISKKMGRYFFRLTVIGFSFFSTLVICSIIKNLWFTTLIFGVGALLSVFAYIYYRSKGLFNKILICKEGIYLGLVFSQDRLFIPWQNVNSIVKMARSSGIELKITVTIGDNIKNIYTDNAVAILNRIDELQIKRDRFNNV